MKTTEVASDLLIEVRETASEDNVIATGYGRAVPYDDPTDLGGLAESFAPGAFEPSDVIGKPFAYRHGEPIGVITEAENRQDGLYIGFNILDTTAGRDGATLMRGGASKGLSVGFAPVESAWNKAKTAVRHTRARLLEVSQTHMPAYQSAGVTAIREENPMSETMDTPTAEVVSVDVEAREALAQLRDKVASLEIKGEPIHPLAEFRSFGHYVKAVYAGETENRALDVQTLADAPGLVPPVWLRDIRGVLDRGRPCITAVGGPISAAGAGMTVNWPYFDGNLASIVATQTNEGDEVNSVDIDIKKGTATLATYAAGSRLSYQVIERTDPSYVDAHQRIMVGAYGTETDFAFQTGLWANDTAGIDYDFSADTTGAAFIEAVWAAAVDVEIATGQPAEVVYVNTAIMKKLGGWSSFQSQNYPVENVGGVFDGRTGRATVMGLPLVMARNFATNETQDAIVTNRAAVGWLEDGPRLATNEAAGNLGRDVAIYGYSVISPFITGGIVGIYNQV
jgi:HK97 family phage prohead protease